MYKQLIKPNLSTKGTIGNCLKYARQVYGQPAKYPTAWSNWQATKYKHIDKLPNVSVPLWFSFYQNGKNFGHVVCYVPGKGYYSSPWKQGTDHAVLKSIPEIERIYGAKYVGWSEDIEDKPVVAIMEDMYTGKFKGKTYKKSAKQWYDVAVTHLKIEQKLEADLKKCKATSGDPTSNDEAVKKSLKDKIVGLIKGA